MREREIDEVKSNWTVIGILIMLVLSGPMILSSTTLLGERSPVQIPTKDSGYIPEMDLSGGEIFSDFDNPSQIDILTSSHLDGAYDRLEPDLTFEEDAELLSDGTDLVGTNGWTWHDVNNSGLFKVAGNRPNNSPTNQAMHHTTASTTLPSAVLTKSMDLQKLAMSFYIYTSEVDVLDLWTNRIAFIGNDTTDPTDDDIAISIGFKDTDAFLNNGQFVRISTTASSSQWYSFIVEIDCSNQKADIRYYRGFFQTRLADMTDIDINGNFESIKRIEFMVQRKVNFQVNTYYDWIKMVDPTDDFFCVTPFIDLREGMRWNFMEMEHIMANDAHMSFEILDPDYRVISNVEWDTYYHLANLTTLNDLGIDSICIKGIFNWDGLFFPSWESFTLDFISENGWRDSFLTDENIARESGVDSYWGFVSLQSSQKNGFYVSREIRIPPNHYWNEMFVDSEYGAGSFVDIDILDSQTGKAITGFSGLKDWKIDIWDLDPLDHPGIFLRAWLNSEDQNFVALHSIGLTWVKNKNPVIHDVEGPNFLFRTYKAHITVNVTDQEEQKTALYSKVEYLPPDGSIWTNSFIETTYFDEKEQKWASVFHPDANATCGNYTFRAVVLDSIGGVKTYEMGNLTVVNNRPTVPDVSIMPRVPKGHNDITVAIEEKSRDIEDEPLTYNITFYVNDELIEERSKNGLTYVESATLHSEYFVKNDKITCIIHSYDGIDASEDLVISFNISNDAPRTIYLDDLYIDLEEDEPSLWDLNLFEVVEDRDRDTLYFDYETEMNVTLEFDNILGTVLLTPAENYSDEGIIIINVTDGEDNATLVVPTFVYEVNDPAAGRIMSPEPDMTVEVETNFLLEAEIWDCDTKIEFVYVEWRTNTDVLANTRTAYVSFSEPGTYEIECWADDQEGEVKIGSVVIEAFKPKPPYGTLEVKREYPGSSIPVVFNITDPYGNGRNPVNDQIGSANITGLTSSAQEEFILIELSLSEPPVQNNIIPEGYGDGEWGYYKVFFVKKGFKEPDFNQSLLNLYSNLWTEPEIEMRYQIGSVYCLTIDENCSYESNIDENKITWTVPMFDLFNAGIPNDDFNLFASAVVVRSENGELISAFDTAGEGAKEHLVNPAEEEKKVNKETNILTPLLVVLLIIAIMIILLLLFLLIGRKYLPHNKETVEKDEIEKERMKEEQKDEEEIEEGKGQERTTVPEKIQSGQPAQSQQVHTALEAMPQRPMMAPPRIPALGHSQTPIAPQLPNDSTRIQ
ncbi:MAG: hypothetical protein ACMUIE_03320 [Thermoplasmatota archaeon]